MGALVLGAVHGLNMTGLAASSHHTLFNYIIIF